MQVKYAEIHQVISATLSMVCVPDYYLETEERPVEDMEFELISPTSDYLNQPSQWTIVGPVAVIKPPLTSDCLSLFRSVWPFHDWIKEAYTLYYFPAVIKQRLPLYELQRIVEENLVRLHNR